MFSIFTSLCRVLSQRQASTAVCFRDLPTALRDSPTALRDLPTMLHPKKACLTGNRILIIGIYRP
ncbi:hypothetical protein, partial [Escherichia coli]|uniref:hypothetical protein n=1 Tax=Escherichia coli TaxID=562 RepID=UPI0023F88EB3